MFGRRKIGMLNRLINILHNDSICRIYVSVTRPSMEYACAIWSGGNTSKCERLKKKFCRRNRFTLTPLKRRFCYPTLLLFFKIKNNISPSYLTSILPPSFKITTPYSLRKTAYPVPYLTRQKTLQSSFPRSII